MPFSSQPLKKKRIQVPPDGKDNTTPSGGTASSPSKVVDLPTEKLQISRLRDKIADKAVTDRRFADKSAIILSNWIGKPKSKR